MSSFSYSAHLRAEVRSPSTISIFKGIGIRYRSSFLAMLEPDLFLQGLFYQQTIVYI